MRARLFQLPDFEVSVFRRTRRHGRFHRPQVRRWGNTLQLPSGHHDQLLHYQPEHRGRLDRNADSICQHSVRTDQVRILYAGHVHRRDQFGRHGDLQHWKSATDLRSRLAKLECLEASSRPAGGWLRREGGSYLIATRAACMLARRLGGSGVSFAATTLFRW